MGEVVRVVAQPTRVVMVAQAVGPQGNPGIDGLDGSNGTDGLNGSSAYELAVAGGFVGTQAAWLASLPGTDGVDGADGLNGTNGLDGSNGADGASAYALAVAGGFVGDQAAWLASLPGADGIDGLDGTNGPSAYAVAVANGFIGTEPAWLTSLVGAPGADGVDGLDGVGVPPARQTTVVAGSGPVALAPTARILAIQSSTAARVRLYRSDAQRAADAARLFTTAPLGDAVLADHDFTAAGTQWTNPVYALVRDGAAFFYSVTGTADVTFTWQEVGA